MSDNSKSKLVPFVSENIGKSDSFTIAIDADTNQLYTFEEKQMKASVFLPLFFVFLIFTRLLSVEYLPLDNLILYTVISTVLFGICLFGGNIMAKKGRENIKKANFTTREWDRYREKGKRFYLRQALFVVFMLILSIACFVFLYIYEAKWWLIGAILSSIFTGNLLAFLSKTRYLLHKDRIEVNMQDEGGM